MMLYGHNAICLKPWQFAVRLFFAVSNLTKFSSSLLVLLIELLRTGLVRANRSIYR